MFAQKIILPQVPQQKTSQTRFIIPNHHPSTQNPPEGLPPNSSSSSSSSSSAPTSICSASDAAFKISRVMWVLILRKLGHKTSTSDPQNCWGLSIYIYIHIHTHTYIYIYILISIWSFCGFIWIYGCSLYKNAILIGIDP